MALLPSHSHTSPVQKELKMAYIRLPLILAATLGLVLGILSLSPTVILASALIWLFANSL